MTVRQLVGMNKKCWQLVQGLQYAGELVYHYTMIMHYSDFIVYYNIQGNPIVQANFNRVEIRQPQKYCPQLQPHLCQDHH